MHFVASLNVDNGHDCDLYVRQFKIDLFTAVTANDEN